MMTKILTILTYTIAILAIPILGWPAASPSNLPLPARLVHQFPEPTWIENIAVRSNGDLLLTMLLPNASLYVLKNPQARHPQPTLLHTFGVHSLLGIAETRPDKFVVVGGNFSTPAVGVQGSFSSWTVEFKSDGLPPKIKRLAHLREAVFLNGVAKLPGGDEVLVADSTLGLAWRLNVETGEYTVGICVPEMAPAPEAPLKIGINGIHYFRGFVYWTNGFKATLYRIRVTGNGYPVPGALVETVAKVDSKFLDDFATDSSATTWATTHLDSKIVAIEPDGVSVVVEGSATELTVAGCTACNFGRTVEDRRILYVVTDGGRASPINGTIVEGGKVVAVDTSYYLTFRSS